MSGRPFNVVHALNSWRMAYPDKEERIRILREELARCRGQRCWQDSSGTNRRREYPQTEKALRRMLELLESGAAS